MKKKTLFAFIITLTLILSSSCDRIEPIEDEGGSHTYADFSQGQWLNNTYTNPWLNISLSLSDDMSIMSSAELAENTSADKYIYNDPTGQPADITSDTSGIYYELALKDTNDILCFLLVIEDPEKTVGSSFVSIDAYVKTTKEMVSQSAVLPYKLSENSTVKLLGESYVTFCASNDYISHTYYITKYENTFVTWVLTEYTSQQASPKALLESIKLLDTIAN